MVSLAVAVGARGARRFGRDRLARRLGAVDAALHTAVRLWAVVAVNLDEGLRQPRREASFVSLLTAPPMPSRLSRLVETTFKACPPPPSRSFWYDLGAAWQLRLLERGLRAWSAAVYASACALALEDDDASGRATPALRRHRKADCVTTPPPGGLVSSFANLLGGSALNFRARLCPWAAACAWPYYCARASKADRLCAAATATPSVASLLRVYWPLDHVAAVACSKLLERCRGLALQRRVQVDGVPCCVYARGAAAQAWLALSDSWERDPHHLDDDDDLSENGDRTAADCAFDVVLHVHGGAFIAAFEAGHVRWFNELAALTQRSTLVVVPERAPPGLVLFFFFEMMRAGVCFFSSFDDFV